MSDRHADRVNHASAGSGVSRREFVNATLAATGAGLVGGGARPGASARAAWPPERISVPGNYAGFSQPVADGYRRTSRYVPVRDGTRIAIDVYRPTRAGRDFNVSLPLVCSCTGYRRAFIMSDEESDAVRHRYPHLTSGEVTSEVMQGARLPDGATAEWIAPPPKAPEAFAAWVRDHGSTREFLLVHGYNLVLIDTRGTGASFGRPADMNSMTIGRDLNDLFEWFAEQPWCDGSIGMIGGSWLGAVQYFALTYGAKHLKAIIPQVAPFDQYLGIYPGGNFNVGLMRDWMAMRDDQDSRLHALPVDNDPDGRMLREALTERRDTGGDAPVGADAEQSLAAMTEVTHDEFDRLEKIHDRAFGDGTRGDLITNPLDFPRANQTKVAVYCWGGWWDLYAKETPIAFANLATPRKLIMGPWHHAGYYGSDHEESLRWFDYWLRGIDNGITREPRCVIATSRPDAPPVWRFADDWPVPGTTRQRLYLAPGREKAAKAIDGLLSWQAPGGAEGVDRFLVDYTASAGPGSRNWGFARGDHLDYSPLRRAWSNGGLMYTTEPGTQDLDVTGHPAVRLFVSLTGTEGSVFAFLEDIGPDGTSYVLAEGSLNLKHRRLRPAPYANLDLPYHSFTAGDLMPITPGEIMEAAFDLTPVSWIVPAGHRLRLTVTGADADNAYQVPENPPPHLTVHRSQTRASYVEVPVVGPGSPGHGARPIPGAFAHLDARARRAVKPSR